MSGRRGLWAICAFVSVVVLASGALGLADGPSQDSLTAAPVAAEAAGTAATSAGGGGDTDCSFLDPCSPAAFQPDSVAGVKLGTPASPNPDSCWYCLVHGTADTYTPWYIGVDYASPVAILSVSRGQTPEPELTLTGAQAAAVLAKDGYDLGYSARLTPAVCRLAQKCPPLQPILLTAGVRFTMSGPARTNERWEIVPIVAERVNSHTDNAWYHFGEKRSSSIQKVVVGLEQVVYS